MAVTPQYSPTLRVAVCLAIALLAGAEVVWLCTWGGRMMRCSLCGGLEYLLLAPLAVVVRRAWHSQRVAYLCVGLYYYRRSIGRASIVPSRSREKMAAWGWRYLRASVTGRVTA